MTPRAVFISVSESLTTYLASDRSVFKASQLLDAPIAATGAQSSIPQQTKDMSNRNFIVLGSDY